MGERMNLTKLQKLKIEYAEALTDVILKHSHPSLKDRRRLLRECQEDKLAIMNSKPKTQSELELKSWENFLYEHGRKTE